MKPADGDRITNSLRRTAGVWNDAINREEIWEILFDTSYFKLTFKIQIKRLLSLPIMMAHVICSFFQINDLSTRWTSLFPLEFHWGREGWRWGDRHLLGVWFAVKILSDWFWRSTGTTAMSLRFTANLAFCVFYFGLAFLGFGISSSEKGLGRQGQPTNVLGEPNSGLGKP